MNRKLAVITAMLFIASGVFLFTFAKTQAATNSITISISPPAFELSANPGEIIKNSIRVTNLSEEPQEIFVDKRNFTALGEEGAVGLTEEETTFSLASWIAVNAEQVTIEARKSHVFEFTVSVPANAEPGGHFGSLVFKTQAKALREGQSGASVGQEVGALLLIKVAGDIKEAADIASFVTEKGFYEKGPVILTTRTKNAGNVHLKPRGTITIQNMFGAEVAKLQLDERNVLPGAIRAVESAWEASGFRMGRYTATLSMVYGDTGKILTASTNFTIIPYKLILLFATIVGVMVFVGYRYRDRFRAAFKALSGK